MGANRFHELFDVIHAPVELLNLHSFVL